MEKTYWLAIFPPLITICIATWSKKIIPSLLVGLITGCYFLNRTVSGGIETAVDQIVTTISMKSNLEVLLFLYLFSGLIFLMKKSGGVKAFTHLAQKHIKSKKGVFFTLWALIPITFIDCGFRVVGAGSITLPLAKRFKIANERMAFMLNNTASPIIELIPIATTFVGFNIAIITQGLSAAGVEDQYSAYSILLKAIPFEFFSIAVIIITFLSIFFQFKKPGFKIDDKMGEVKMDMDMSMEDENSVLKPKFLNFIFPMISVIMMSVYFFWQFGKNKNSSANIISAISDTDPNKAMLVSLLITVIMTSILYSVQKYNLKKMTTDFIYGGNEIMKTLIILGLAWPLAAVTQELGLSQLIEQQVGNSMPFWILSVSLFLLSSFVTYFIGSSWGAASLIMPFAIPLAVSVGSSIPLCVAAVITGGTFGDVTSPVAGMTNMSSNVAHADHSQYLKYARPYNFISAGIAAVLFLAAGFYFH
jgi:tetracycline resistance efflux pump